jgi:hypothetical protein
VTAGTQNTNSRMSQYGCDTTVILRCGWSWPRRVIGREKENQQNCQKIKTPARLAHYPMSCCYSTSLPEASQASMGSNKLLWLVAFQRSSPKAHHRARNRQLTYARGSQRHARSRFPRRAKVHDHGNVNVWPSITMNHDDGKPFALCCLVHALCCLTCAAMVQIRKENKTQ